MVEVAKDKPASGLAARMRALRESAGYSQIEAAAELGVSRATYLRYEAGTSAPTFDEVCKLAALYGVEIAAFQVPTE
jgi:transcriptional regulator with XRE-family HTH domain